MLAYSSIIITHPIRFGTIWGTIPYPWKRSRKTIGILNHSNHLHFSAILFEPNLAAIAYKNSRFSVPNIRRSGACLPIWRFRVANKRDLPNHFNSLTESGFRVRLQDLFEGRKTWRLAKYARAIISMLTRFTEHELESAGRTLLILIN